MESIAIATPEQTFVMIEDADDKLAAIKELKDFELALVGGGSATLLY